MNTIFREYSGKEPILQLILYSFVKETGTCPEGSILTLKSGQFAYVVNRQGPEVIIFTDKTGRTAHDAGKIIDLSSRNSQKHNLFIDGQHLPQAPVEVFDRLPGYLRRFHLLLDPEADA